jgi:hypothetical protein
VALGKLRDVSEEVEYIFKTINSRGCRKHKILKMNGFWDKRGWSKCSRTLKLKNKIKEDI